jgi:excisionase family DNA binding protein
MAELDTNTREGIEAIVASWARSIPLEQIPGVVALLFARLVVENGAGLSERNHLSPRDGETLLTARELAGRLRVPESWVRTEERAGRLPGLRLGKYVRFKLSEVERALSERQLPGA